MHRSSQVKKKKNFLLHSLSLVSLNKHFPFSLSGFTSFFLLPPPPARFHSPAASPASTHHQRRPISPISPPIPPINPSRRSDPSSGFRGFHSSIQALGFIIEAAAAFLRPLLWFSVDPSLRFFFFFFLHCVNLIAVVWVLPGRSGGCGFG